MFNFKYIKIKNIVILCIVVRQISLTYKDRSGSKFVHNINIIVFIRIQHPLVKNRQLLRENQQRKKSMHSNIETNRYSIKDFSKNSCCF